MNAPNLDYLALPVSTRLQLVEAIWDSIPAANPNFFSLSRRQLVELDRRWERAQSQPETCVSADQMRRLLFTQPAA